MYNVTARTQIQASPELVWTFVSDGSRLAEWLTLVSSVRELESPLVLTSGTKVKIKMSGRVPPGQLAAFEEVVPGRILTFKLGPAFAHWLGIAMRAELEVEPEGEGTAATVSFTCNPITGPLQQRISGMKLAEEANNTLRRLKEAAEE